MLNTALTLNGPCAIRYPRGSGIGVTIDNELKVLPVGKAEVKIEGKDAYIIAIGNTVYPAMEAAKSLAAHGISCGVLNCRFLKPLDEKTILSIACRVKNLVVVEENARLGGLYSSVSELLINNRNSVLSIGLPDSFIEHGHPSVLREKYGLTAGKIAETTLRWIKNIEKKDSEVKIG
jgi:1-deoxy-D-xylulose-5-phosphate synthase